VHYSTPDSPTSTDDRSHTCLRCGAIDMPTIGPGKGPHHASALCRHCGAWLGGLSRYPPAARQARRQQARNEAMARKPATILQLSYLRALGDVGPPPATTLEASQRIDLLTGKARQ
jgi:hypothetical protein